MATSVIKEYGETSKVKQEKEDIINPFWNPFQTNIKKEIPLLVLYDLADEKNEAHREEATHNYETEDVINPAEFEYSSDETENDVDPLSVLYESPKYRNFSVTDGPTVDEESQFLIVETGENYTHNVLPKSFNYTREQESSDHSQKVGNTSQSYSSGKNITYLKSQNTKKEKKKQGNGVRRNNDEAPLNKTSSPMSIEKSERKQKQESKQKQIDSTQVRKSQRKFKRSVLYYDYYVTYTSEMFEPGQFSVKQEENSESQNTVVPVSKQNLEKSTPNTEAATHVIGKSAKKKKKEKKLKASSFPKEKKKKKKIEKQNLNAVQVQSEHNQAEASYKLNFSQVKEEDPNEFVAKKIKQEFSSESGGQMIKQEFSSESGGQVFKSVVKKPRARKWFCEYCPESFTDIYYLRLHKMLHTNERPYKCDICNKGFRMRWRVKLHRMTHTKEKPFSCDYCDHRCNRRDNLMSHIKRNHTDIKKEDLCTTLKKEDLCTTLPSKEPLPSEHFEKSFPCDYCNGCYNRKDNLMVHIKRCHVISKNTKGDEEQFNCNMCTNTFKSKSGLKHHLEKHYPDRPFPCQYCMHRSKRKTHLKSHIKHRHPELMVNGDPGVTSKVEVKP